MQKNILGLFLLCTYILANGLLRAIDISDSEEQAYQRTKHKRVCHIDGLAGNHKIELCDLINRFKPVLVDPTPYRNALLLSGPPGTGKTTIAEKIAHMTNAQFIHKSAASFVTYKQGSGAQMVRDTFEKEVEPALKNGKVVLFIDEVDAFTRERSHKDSEDHANALLELMQKVTVYRKRSQLLIVVATNKKELLDDGVVSRFREIEVPLPDKQICYEIFEHHLNQFVHKLDKQQIKNLALQVYQARLSGRDIEDVVQDAYLRSSAVGATKILFGALSDLTEDACHKKKLVHRKKEEEEAEVKKEKEIRDLQLKTLRHEENERFYQRFIAPQKQ